MNELIKKHLCLDDILIFPYGSRVYGTNKNNSDYDYIVVVPDNSKLKTGSEISYDNLDLHIYQKTDFKNQLDLHKINILECWYNPSNNVKNLFKFKLDKFLLRDSISQKASHSFVKAKKKIEVEKDYFIGLKSLFHSLRILNFGTQIAKNNSIDFSAANFYWDEIKNINSFDWNSIKEKYQPEYNRLSTEFRIFAPKNVDK